MADKKDARIYCIDSSSLIAAWHERYRPTNFGSFWASLHGLIASGHLIASEKVGEEISKKDDGLKQWSKSHSDLFVPLDTPQQEALIKILKSHEYLAKDFPTRNRADAFVIALAKVNGSTVVTEEGPGSPKKPKIPDVCRHYGIPVISLADLIADQGWDF